MNHPHPHILQLMAVDRHSELVARADTHALIGGSTASSHDEGAQLPLYRLARRVFGKPGAGTSSLGTASRPGRRPAVEPAHIIATP